MAGMTSTNMAMHGAILAAGSVALIVGMFLGFVIAGPEATSPGSPFPGASLRPGRAMFERKWRGRVSTRGAGKVRHFLTTSEFWLMVIGVAVILLVGYNNHRFDVRDAWILATALAGTYILSRGIAKAGSSDRDPGRDRY
jgi:hypothetical protein